MKLFILTTVLVAVYQTHVTSSTDITTSLGKTPVKAKAPAVSGIAQKPKKVEEAQRSGIGFDTQFFNSLGGHQIGGYGLNGNCPMQTDILDNLRLSDNPIGYPIDEIAAELALRPQFAAFLVDQAVLPGTDPTIPEDPRFLAANMTCPFIRKQLWSFFRNNTICWLLQDFQQQFFFAECIFKTCQFCSNPFGFNTQNQCLKQYELISAYVYCPNIGFPRIISERIIIPSYCTCKVVNCQQNLHHNNIGHGFGNTGFGNTGFGNTGFGHFGKK